MIKKCNIELLDALSDLIDRMDEAEVKLIELSNEHKPLSHESIRLESKANGVALAKSYVNDALRWHREH